jgi:hypothetical protein
MKMSSRPSPGSIRFVCLALSLAFTLAGCASPASDPAAAPAARTVPAAAPPAAAAEAPQVESGNGQANWIVVEGATRSGATFTFSEVQIARNGWLVMHPFKDGKPVGDIYVGATYIASGSHRNVEISVESEPTKGEMFIVMLHSDVNENQEFDFVFVDERNVLDKAVFEGTTMVAHAIAAP